MSRQRHRSPRSPRKSPRRGPSENPEEAGEEGEKEIQALKNSEPVRCGWSVKEPIYIAYHDEEWGVPNTIRARYTKNWSWTGFKQGSPGSRFSRSERIFAQHLTLLTPKNRTLRQARRERLVKNSGIIRSRTKIEAAVRGAQFVARDRGTNRADSQSSSGSMSRETKSQSLQVTWTGSSEDEMSEALPRN